MHRCLEELKGTCDVAKVTSWRAALVTLRAKVDLQIMNRNGFKEPESVKHRLFKKHQVMIDYLERKYKDYWNRYHCAESAPECDNALRHKIWVCWWQGLENAPEIVKACIKSIKRHAGPYEVICITKKNYRNFIQFPDWIEEKREHGVFSITHFSDILRMSLLAKYGGIWVDATFFCVGVGFETYMEQPLWSIKRPDYKHGSVACGNFSGFSLGCSQENRWMFGVIRDFLFNYWKDNEKLIDYLLIDYAVVLAQRHNAKIAEAFKRIEPNNPNCDELCKVLGNPYDADKWEKIKKDTVLFKLTWKQHFDKKVNGKKTFYGKLIDETLA